MPKAIHGIRVRIQQCLVLNPVLEPLDHAALGNK